MKVHFRLVSKQFASAEHNIDPLVEKVNYKSFYFLYLPFQFRNSRDDIEIVPTVLLLILTGLGLTFILTVSLLKIYKCFRKKVQLDDNGV